MTAYSVSPLQVVAFQAIIKQAMLGLGGLDPAQLEEAARWMLDQRGVPCLCGQCPPAGPEDDRALEATAAVLVAASELVAATRHAEKCSTAAMEAIAKRRRRT